MARIVTYDVSAATPQDNAPVPPGLYEVVIEDISAGDSQSSGAPMLTVTFKITKGDHKGRKFWYYIMLDGSTDGRFREFVDALDLKAKGQMDLDKIKGMVAQVKTNIEKGKDGYDDKGRVKNVLPADGASSGEEEEDAPPYPEWEQGELAEEYEARELTSISGKKTKAALVRALEADDAAKEGEEEGDDEDSYTMADLEELDRAGLKKLIKEEELEIRVTTKTTDETLREKIAEALEIGDDEEEEEEPDESEEEEEDEDDGLDDLSRAQLKKHIKDNSLEVRVTTKMSDDDIREAIRAASGEGEEEESDEEEEEVEPYEKWELSDLKTELKERGLKTDGRKSILVKRLEQDDAKDGEPF